METCRKLSGTDPSMTLWQKSSARCASSVLQTKPVPEGLCNNMTGMKPNSFQALVSASRLPSNLALNLSRRLKLSCRLPLKKCGQLFSMGTLNAKMSSKFTEPKSDQLQSEVVDAGTLPTPRWLSTPPCQIPLLPCRSRWSLPPTMPPDHQLDTPRSAGRGPRCVPWLNSRKTFSTKRFFLRRRMKSQSHQQKF